MSEILSAVRKIQPFPPVATALIRAAGDEDASLSDVAKLIEAESVIAGGILSLANSPLFGTRSEVRTITHAVSMLGLERIKAYATTVVLRSFVHARPHVPGMRTSWLHSVATALIAGELASLWEVQRDEAYTAGLLHDVGRIGLAAAYPDRYGRLLAERHASAGQVLERERIVFGADHCEAGRILSEDWGLPASVAEVAGQHHAPRPGVNHASPLPAVKTACALATALRFEALSYADAPSFDEIRRGVASPVRERFNWGVEELEDRIVERVHSLDVLDAG